MRISLASDAIQVFLNKSPIILKFADIDNTQA